MATTRRAGLALALGLCAPGAWPRGAAAPVRRLTVAAFPAIDKIVLAAEPAWRARFPEVELRVISRQDVDHHTAMTTALSTAAGLPDLMALEISYLGRFAGGAGLDDLRQPPYGADALRERFVRYAWAQGRNARGEQIALPTDIGPGTLLYRHDLLARAGIAEAELIASWDAYVEAGLRIKSATGAYLLSHARDLKNIMIRSGLQAGEGLYYGADGQVLVNGPRFANAFRLAREVRKNQLDAKVYAWSTDWSEGFRRGAIATQMMGAWLVGHLNGWLAPGTRGLWRAAQLPGGSFAAFGGSFYAIPRAAASEGKPYAWALLKLLSTEPALQLAAFKAHDAFPALAAAHDDAFFDDAIPFLGGQRARRVWRDAARRIQAPTLHKQDPFADEVINTELDKVLDRGKDIASALGDAERLLRQRAHR